MPPLTDVHPPPPPPGPPSGTLTFVPPPARRLTEPLAAVPFRDTHDSVVI